MQNKDSNLETLFSNALDLKNEKERDSYIRNACGGDSSRLAELQSMLRDYSAAGAMFDRPAAIAPTLAAESTSPISRQIGPYKLRELLGEGGMGSVYVAEQEKPVRRKVALKIIKPGMGSREVISRFESERQALALMDHPNIARVLDAGTTENGLPYFVMELVKGLPITAHCDAQKLGTRDRLDLFLQVCQAIQHAHQKGIIHRDIKPSNVIVAIHDVRPVVKVIDFGVAKAIGQQLTENTLYTAFSQMVGTPLYMSPEQAGQSSLDIDTRSDVYSLGVLLYELLTGNTPFDKDTLKQAGFEEMRRIIREVDPPRPSARVSTLNALAQSTVAEKRQLEPRKLRQSFRGELDWIVMKAMEKDRDRRYETANAFASDIQKFLDDEPVQACPPSWSYRFGKALRRHRMAAVFAVGVLASMSLGLLIAFWQLQRALIAESKTSSALSRVEEQKVVSERRLAIAEQAVDDMYVQVASKWLSQQAGLTQVQREFLEKAIATYEKLAETEEGGSIRLRSISASIKLGSLHSKLGRTDQALEILLRTIRLANELCDREPKNLLARLKLADAQRAASSVYQGKRLSENSIDLADKALANLREIDPNKLENVTDKVDYLSCFTNLTGGLASEASRKAEAMQGAELIVSEARRLVDQFPENKELRFRLSQSFSVQGMQLLWWGGRNEESLAAYQSSLAMLDELAREGYDDTEILSASSHPLANIKVLLRRLDRKNELAAAYEKERSVLEVLCSRFPEQNNYGELLANCLKEMATDANERGNRLEADKHNDRALKILTAIFDRNPSPRASVFVSLVQLQTLIGSQYANSSDNARAIEALEQARSRQAEFAISNPKDFQAYLMGFNVMAELAPAYLRVGSYDKAAELVEACMHSHAAYLAASGRPADTFTARDLNGLVLSLTCVARLFDYCEQAAMKDESQPEYRRKERVESLRRSRDSVIADASKYAELWSKSVMKSDLPLQDIVPLLKSHTSWVFPCLVDSENAYLFPSHEKSLQFVIENSIVERNILLLSQYAAAIHSTQQVPKEWSSIAMVLASSPELSVAPKTFLQFCKLAHAESASDVSAQQALAWTLFRNDMWKECIEILDSATFRDDPCNSYLLAMAYHHLANPAKASLLLQETELFVSSNSKPTKDEPQKFADAKTISEIALRRLQWEAKSLMKTR